MEERLGNGTANELQKRSSEQIALKIGLTLNGIAIITHVIGLISIYLYKKRTNGNIILGSLSMFELLIATSTIGTNSHRLTFVSKSLFDICSTVRYVLIYELVFTMLILTIDRCVCMINPLKYNYRMTRKRIILSLIVSCLISITLGILKGIFKRFQ